MYPVPIETLRERLGLDSADASRDAEIAQFNAAAFALMANYCDRYFQEVLGGEQEFVHVSGETLSLDRYPVTQITSMVNGDGREISMYHLGKVTGLIHFDYPFAFHLLTVVTDAGYAEGEFPADLLTAYYAIFDQQEESGVSNTNIESVTVADVGTVRYGKTDSMSGGFIPVVAGSILDSYKRFKA